MAFGSNFANQATNDWQDYLKKIQEAQQQSMKAPAVPPRAIAPGNTQRDLSYQSQQPISQQQAIASGGGQIKSSSINSSNQGEQPAGKGTIGDNTYIKPGQWYSDFDIPGIAKLSQDPGRAVDLWAKKTGKGSAYGQMLNSMIDPISALRLMGADAGKLSQSNTRPLDAMAQLWKVMSGDSTFGGNQMYIDPTGMLSNVLNAKYKNGDPALSLGQSVGNPQLLPEAQIQNTMGLILSGLQGFVSDSALSAYSAMMEQAAMDFMNDKDTGKIKYGDQTFNQYLKQRFGSGGGLF